MSHRGGDPALVRLFRELPRYEIVGWKGRRSFDAGGGQFPLSRDGVTHWAISAGVQHTDADHVHLTVMSHSRVPERDLGRTQGWAINAIRQGSQDFGLPAVERTEQLKRDIALEMEAERLRDLAGRGELACRSEIVAVDTIPTPFEVYEVDGGRPYPGQPIRLPLWAAFGRLAEIDLILDSWGVPLQDLALQKVTDPVPDPHWIDPGLRPQI